VSDAPERIWAWQGTDPLTDEKWGAGEWYTEDVGLDGDEVVYVRADLYEELERELENTLDSLHDMTSNDYPKDK